MPTGHPRQRFAPRDRTLFCEPRGHFAGTKDVAVDPDVCDPNRAGLPSRWHSEPGNTVLRGDLSIRSTAYDRDGRPTGGERERDAGVREQVTTPARQAPC
jgi:hypothetical protein